MLLLILTILESFLTGLDTKVLSSKVSIQVTEQSMSQPMAYTGHIAMQGERFVLSAFDTEAAYDGKTLYVYNEDLDELTLTTPTREELTESNPLLYARALYKVCNLTERDSQSGKETIITLTPRDKSAGILRVVLRLEKTTLLPKSLEVVEAKRTTLLKMLDAAYSTEKPTFKIEAPKSAYVNDLR